MLEMLFENYLGDDDYSMNVGPRYIINNSNTKKQQQQQQQPKRKNYTININKEHYHSFKEDHNYKNEEDDDWGFYIDIDQTTTPPKKIYYPSLTKEELNPNRYQSKYMNLVNNRTELPIIKEEKSRENVIFDEEDHEEQFSLDLSEHNITDITNSKLISKSIFSGITICALTGASLYYYSKFRNL